MSIKKGYNANLAPLADGNFTLMLVPAEEVTDLTAPTATLLNGASSYDATYDLTPDGWAHTPQNEEITTDRLTLPQSIIREGKQTDTLEITYAYKLDKGEGDTETDEFLTVGARYVAFARYGVEHDEDFAADQDVDVFPVKCGRKRKNAPTAGAELTKTVALTPTSKVLDDVKVVAGA
ncbi:phage tail tube protein [Gulosibacter faecalis]|uniref:Phage tail protein n=1 Tax=Gulosibacter faecalis TaxID=272240 RepID=A0ABW5UXK1_9MICO|nr:hypothetical protein [Gulosibacter faecalis]